jgi:hypothetical protein
MARRNGNFFSRTRNQAHSKKRAEHGRNFFDDDTQAQSAPAQFGVQFGVGIFRAFKNVPHVRFVLGKTFRVRMTRISPMPQQPFAKRRHAPDHPSVFQLGVFLKMVPFTNMMAV